MSYLNPVPNKLAVFIYRLSNKMYRKRIYFLAYFFQRFNMVLNCIEIHPNAQIGKNFTIAHSTGIVIGKNVIIGKNVKIYSSVVLGVKKTGEPNQPKIGDNVVLSAGAKLLGGITVGENAIIGANSVVLDNVEINSMVAGVPAKKIKG